jgi:hypothetical protein
LVNTHDFVNRLHSGQGGIGEWCVSAASYKCLASAR